MIRYNDEYLAKVRLQRIADNPSRPEKVRNVAKRVLKDEKLFNKYISMKKEKLESIRKEKVRKDRKKNLTGWKKGVLVLFEGLGLM